MRSWNRKIQVVRSRCFLNGCSKLAKIFNYYWLIDWYKYCILLNYWNFWNWKSWCPHVSWKKTSIQKIFDAMERLRKKEKGQYEDNIIDVCGQDFHMGKKIETCLTPNHLLFGRQLLYYFNTTSKVPDSSPAASYAQWWALCSNNLANT